MANARSAWGIDIGNRALKAVRLVRDGAGALKVDDFEVHEHETVLSQAGDNRDQLIQTALANFVGRHPAKTAVAGISVSGVQSFARFIKLPPVEKRKIPEIVRFEAIQQIPFPLDDVEWSYQLFEQPDSPDVEVGIFAMRRELVDHQIKAYTDVELNVQVVQMNPLAVYNAMYHDDRIKGTTMIIDMGAENTDLIIADNDTIWLRSIPIGGNNFTDILVKQFKLAFPKAEELKRTAATSKYAKQIFQAMRPVFADLVAEVQRSIGFYSSVHRDSRIKKVIALGGTFKLPGLQKYLQQNLQLDVERIDRFVAGAPDDAKMAATFNENLLSLVSAYGLAVQAMGQGKVTSSLLPARIRREQQWKEKNKWFGVAAASFLLGTGLAGGMWLFHNMSYDQAADRRKEVDDVVKEATQLDNSWKSDVEQAGQADRQKITNVRGMLTGRGVWPNLISDIYSAVPKPDDAVLASGDFDAIKEKFPKRTDRKTLVVEDVFGQYEPAVDKYVTTGVATFASGGFTTTPPPVDPTAAAAAAAAPGTETVVPAGSHGYIIKVDLSTPYGGDMSLPYRFVKESFIKNLKAMNNPNNPKGYYIVRTDIKRSKLVSLDEPRKLVISNQARPWQLLNPPPVLLPPTTPGGPGTGTGTGTTLLTPAPTPVALTAAEAQAAMLQDRYFAEDMSTDTTLEAEVVVVVVDPDVKAP